MRGDAESAAGAADTQLARLLPGLRVWQARPASSAAVPMVRCDPTNLVLELVCVAAFNSATTSPQGPVVYSIATCAAIRQWVADFG